MNDGSTPERYTTVACPGGCGRIVAITTVACGICGFPDCAATKLALERIEAAADTTNKPYTCVYCMKPTAQAPYHLPGERYMPACCVRCVGQWDDQPLSHATTEELLRMQPARDGRV